MQLFTACSARLGVLRNPIRIVVLLALAAVFAVPAADARHLAVRKAPQVWEELRRGSGERVMRLTRFQELKAAQSAERRHGHLQFGPKLPSLLERADLEKRPGFLRGLPDTTIIKVAVIRIEFETDRMGPETTGDGRFMRDNPDPDSLFIDPPPHNEKYFAAHLEAVNRYWSSMTYGNVAIEGDVFPRNDEFGAYRLTDMADYGPETDDEAFNIPGLIRYARESLIVADADPDLVWSDYDVYFVVHAGSDWQNDVFQNSRFDLPTFSISFSDSEIVVTDEGDSLITMITYPETSAQDGFLVALNGGIAHEMGHQLGLFDIYNVETFAPTVAYYSIMDSGNLASVFVPRPGAPIDPSDDDLVEVIGVLPTAPGAWSRWLITFNFGLDPPLLKKDVGRLKLRAIQSRATEGELASREYKWFRVPISDTEYFLVENRVDDMDGRIDGFINTALDQDDSTGVVLGPIKGDSDLLSHNYDLLIDPGVLIWHVDERQALSNLSIGRGLNVTFEKRAVTIEEADGLIDIGNPFSLFPLGTPNETWHADNAYNFTPSTRPNTDSNLGTPTGIAITNISERDTLITMSITIGNKPRGWPMEIGPYGSGGRTSTTLVDVDGDGVAEVAAASDTNLHLYRYEDQNNDGEVETPGTWPVPSGGLPGRPEFTQAFADFDGDGMLEMVAATDSGGVHVFENDGTPWPLSDSLGTILQYVAGGFPTWSPLPVDLNGDGSDELYVVTQDGFLRGYNVTRTGPPGQRFAARKILGSLADSVDTLITTLGAADLTGDGRAEGYLAYVHEDSLGIQRFDAAGFRPFRVTHPLTIADGAALDRDRIWMSFADLDRAPGGAGEIVVATESGYVGVFDAFGGLLPGWPRMIEDLPVNGPPAIGDLDGDGFLEIALTSGLRTVHAFNYNGVEMAGWPIHLELVDYPRPGRRASPPVIADVDGDGRQDVVAGFTDFTIRAISADGGSADGFPLSAGAPVGTAPAILDANGDGRLDLFVQAGDGKIAGHILMGTASATNPQWPMFGGGPRLHGAFDPARLPIAEKGGDRVLNGPVVVYPNPVRGHHHEVRVRYTLGSQLAAATQVNITLYNVAGEMVETMSGTVFPSTENEVSMPADALASGVYFCTVEARSGTRVETHQGKFAVVR